MSLITPVCNDSSRTQREGKSHTMNELIRCCPRPHPRPRAIPSDPWTWSPRAGKSSRSSATARPIDTAFLKLLESFKVGCTRSVALCARTGFTPMYALCSRVTALADGGCTAQGRPFTQQVRLRSGKGCKYSFGIRLLRGRHDLARPCINAAK